VPGWLLTNLKVIRESQRMTTVGSPDWQLIAPGGNNQRLRRAYEPVPLRQFARLWPICGNPPLTNERRPFEERFLASPGRTRARGPMVNK
jgi:hypothetical protein